MSQRQKARDFLRREGHGSAMTADTVKEAPKNRAVDPHRSSPEPARAGMVYEGGSMATDGLLRGHCNNA